ncbi:MAG: YqjD family protein [Piscinibacter sp.]
MAKERLNADFAKVMEDIDALVNATATKAEGEATALRARIRDRLGEATDTLSNAQRAAVARAKDAAKATDEYVHEHPWQMVGAAAAVGLAIGVLIGRR